MAPKRRFTREQIAARKAAYYRKHKDRDEHKRKKYYEDNKDKIKKRSKDSYYKCKGDYLMENYGISIEVYNEMRRLQNNKCLICGNTFDNKTVVACVDHNHTTGKVRGILCRTCNIGIGNLKDDISLLAMAIKYLEKND